MRLAPLALLFAFAACDGAGAPTQPGACWRTVGGTPRAPRFTLVANDVDSLDDCAAMLETYHLRGARTANGAYHGYFIFIDDHEVASSTRQDGFRYPIFQPAQRREIDGDLIGLIKDHQGQAPPAKDIAVERR